MNFIKLFPVVVILFLIWIYFYDPLRDQASKDLRKDLEFQVMAIGDPPIVLVPINFKKNQEFQTESPQSLDAKLKANEYVTKIGGKRFPFNLKYLQPLRNDTNGSSISSENK